MIKRIKNTKKYQIYIGMKDKEKMKQLFSKEDFIKMITQVCLNYKISFTMGEVYGGYITSNGEFICEDSVVLSIMGLTQKEAFELVENLKIKLNQEAIMITEEKPNMFIAK